MHYRSVPNAPDFEALLAAMADASARTPMAT
jgi:hypothetical protein